MPKVFSIDDFKLGLDTRKTPLTAPGGSLRVLENAVVNQGGEIEKRFAFVNVTTLPPEYLTIQGQGGNLHAFAVGSGSPIDQGTCPIPIVQHILEAVPGDTITSLVDVEAYADKFFVCGWGATLAYCWYDGVLVKEADGSLSHGTYARVWRSKMYRIDGPYLRFSGVNNPAQNDPASVDEPGAGFINMALNDTDGEFLQGMEVYYAQMAVMSRLQAQMWTLNPDLTQDQIGQLLRIGTIAPHSMVQFGTGDVLFLSDSGVRSLHAMNINLAASVEDAGSAIDLILTPLVKANQTLAALAVATVQPIQGRYWLALMDTIYVLSYFPAGNITAWSTFKPGFTTRWFARVLNQTYALDTANNLYLYGGADNETYDSCTVTVTTPHHSADAPTENKRIKSIDVMCQGQWSLSVGMLASNTNIFELVGNMVDNTYGAMSIPFAGYGTHFGVQMVNQAPGPALLAAIHLNLFEGVTK